MMINNRQRHSTAVRMKGKTIELADNSSLRTPLAVLLAHVIYHFIVINGIFLIF